MKARFPIHTETGMNGYVRVETMAGEAIPHTRDGKGRRGYLVIDAPAAGSRVVGVKADGSRVVFEFRPSGIPVEVQN